MAPYLFLGFAVAGLLSVLVSKTWIEQHLGGQGVKPVVKATLLGIPLPLCSCGVIPVAASLRQHGGSKGATSAFLLATPQTGVDSILATYGLLGPIFAIIRPIVALVTGIAGGVFVNRSDKDESQQATATNTQLQSTSCSSMSANPAMSLTKRAASALHYGLIRLPGHIAKPLILGVFIAGALTTLIGEDALAPWLGHPVYGLLVMMAIGIPLYVCATGSIPLALGFMYLGATPGAALVFLITGPATNAATLSVTWKMLGKSAAIICFITAASIALASGYALDFFIGASEMSIPETTHVHSAGISWTTHAWAAALAGMLVVSLIIPKLKSKLATTADPSTTLDTTSTSDEQTSVSVETIHLNIEGMRCSHCSDSASRALNESAGVQSATVNLDAGTASVQGSALDANAMIQALDQLGFQAKVIQ